MTGAVDMAPRLITLRAIQVWRGGGQSPAGPVDDRRSRLQIAQEFVRRRRGRLRLDLPLRFQKQLRLRENALAGLARAIAPGGIQLGGLPRVAVEFDERRDHLPAVFQAHACDGSEKLHGDMRADLAVAHLLLNGFRKQFDQR